MSNSTIRIAAVQMDVVLGAAEANLSAIERRLRQAAEQGAKLVAFPECAVTGYCFDSLAEALTMAETLPGPTVVRLTEACRQLDVFAVTGLLERDGERVYNVAALIGPAGLVARYRKTHLPHLGVDRFTTAGDEPYAVASIDGLRLGMNICYDGAFPEPSRALALAGADLVVLPTNWPPGAETTAEFVINARALENNIYYAAANRIGEERGFRFIGRSRICGPQGHTLAEAPHEDEITLYADINPATARNKHLVRVAAKHEIDRFKDRRPDLYGPLLEK